MNVFETVRQWMVKANQISQEPEINVRRSAFQIGMQCEELCEKLTRTIPGHSLLPRLKAVADTFKSGEFDHMVDAVLKEDPEGFLDDDLDILWVTLGALAAQGADGQGGFTEVNKRNWEKYPDGVVTLDDNGKVVKPQGWIEPYLVPFTYVGRSICTRIAPATVVSASVEESAHLDSEGSALD